MKIVQFIKGDEIYKTIIDLINNNEICKRGLLNIMTTDNDYISSGFIYLVKKGKGVLSLNDNYDLNGFILFSLENKEAIIYYICSLKHKIRCLLIRHLYNYLQTENYEVITLKAVNEKKLINFLLYEGYVKDKIQLYKVNNLHVYSMHNYLLLPST